MRPTWKFRGVAMLAVVAYFFVGYGLLGFYFHGPGFDATTAFDNAIPFIPAFIVFYFIGDIFLLLPFLLIKNEKRIMKVCKAMIVMMTIAYLLFFLIPIRYEKSVVYDDTIFSTMARAQHVHDTEYNNFPSLHVALTLFAWLVLRRENKRVGWITMPFMLGVIASVVLVKQHLIIDVLGGIILASGTYYLWNKEDRPDGPVRRNGRA